MVLNRFFKSLEAYLEGDGADDNHNSRNNSGDDGISRQLPFDMILQTGLPSCGECSEVMEGFCQLYDQLKSIQLQLNGKLLAVKNILGGALTKPGRKKGFRDCVNQLGIGEGGEEDGLDAEETIDFIFQFNGDLVQECSRKLDSFSRVHGKRQGLVTDELLQKDGDIQPGPSSGEDETDDLIADPDDFHDDPLNPHETVPQAKPPQPEEFPKPAKRKYKGESSDADIPNPTITRAEVGSPKSSLNSSTGKYKCSRCPREFLKKDLPKFGFHFRRDHLLVRYQCPFPLCLKQFSGRIAYERHYESIHAGIRHICHKCGKQYYNKVTLSEHLKNSDCAEGEASKPVCPICGKAFSRQFNVRLHVKVVHMKSREHLSDLCGIGYKLKGDLNRHRKRVHGVGLGEAVTSKLS